MKQKNLGIFTPIMVGIATIVILSVVIFRITGKAKEQETAGSVAYNKIADLETTAGDTVDWVDIMVIAIVGFAVIGYFAFGRR